VETVLDIGLGNALIALIMAPAVAVIGWVCRRPAVTHGLWLLVLLKLLTPPIWPVPVPWPTPAPSADAVSPVVLSRVIPSEPRGGPSEPAAEAPVAPMASAASVAPTFSWQFLVAGAWLTGSSLWVALVGWRWFRFHRLLRVAQPASASLQERARRVAERLGVKRCPTVQFVSGPASPLLWAVGRARLLLPADLWPRLTDVQRDTLLVHELAHLRRRDHWVRRLELVVLALYWWHPVVWWARRELQEAEEECCDAWVVWALPSSAPAYADALVETVTFLSRSRPALPLGASGMGQAYVLKRRLTMIMRGTTPRSLSRLGLLAMLALGAALLPLAPSWSQQPPSNDAPAPPLVRGAGEPQSNPRPEPPAGRPSKQVKTTSPSDDAHEELELLQAQLDGKRAELQEASARVAQAMLEVERLNRLNSKGAVDDSEVERAQSEVDVMMARVAGKQAQVREAEIRLRHARRRLDVPANARPAAEPLPAADNSRLKDLEKKLDDLRKELKQLRKDLRPPQAGAAAPPATPTGDKKVRVGQIIIAGNERTAQEVILKTVPIFPGQLISYADLRAAEHNLEKLNRFQVNSRTGVRPTITVLDSDSDSPFKDILIQVKEKDAATRQSGCAAGNLRGSWYRRRTVYRSLP
jgi:beta-lactamase regulating signal transducer with metallopeptidase domain